MIIYISQNEHLITYTMKTFEKISLVVFFFVLACGACLAQEVVSVRFASGGEKHLTADALRSRLQNLEAQGVHKLDLWKHLDEENTESCVSGVAIGLKGPLAECVAEAVKHGTSDPFKTVSWWSVDSPKGAATTIRFRIKPNGLATMDLIQKGQIIGSGRARTNSDVSKQPAEGTYKASKTPESEATRVCGRPARKSYHTSEKVGKDVYMTYPIHIYQGFFAHGGNNSGESGGCMRMNELCEVAYSFNITKIIIEHLKN